MKTVIYASVVGVGLFLMRNATTSWAVVFLFALSAVHSNDLTIGRPLLQALFNNTTDATSQLVKLV